ncbi:MAG: plasmid replication initiator TrfA [Candidatus Zixiibacteriota bacterium]
MITSKQHNPAGSDYIIQLPYTGDRYRKLPHCLSRSAVFGVNRQERQMYDRRPVPSSTGLSVTYTGPALHQGHADVYLEAVHRAQYLTLGGVVSYAKTDYLASMGRRGDGRSMRAMRQQLDDLVAATLSTDRFTGSLIHKAHYEGGWLILDSEIWQLFHENEFSCQEIAMRRLLRQKDLAKWFLSFYASHRADGRPPQRNRLDELHYLCGSMASRKKFREQVRGALDDLRGIGFVETYAITKNGALEVTKRNRTSRQPSYVTQRPDFRAVAP